MRRVLTAVFGLCLAHTPAVFAVDTLSEIKETGIVKVGYRQDIPPFSQLSAKGGPEGFSIDICNRIAESVGKQLRLPDIDIVYVQVTAANRLDAVVSGDIHIECGNTTSTHSRQELVDFSNLFYVSGGSLMTTADLSVTSIRDLAGRRVAVVENTTTLKVLRDQMAEAHISAHLEIVSAHNEAVKLLEQKKVDMVAADRATLLGLGFTSEKLKVLRLTPVMLSFEPYAFPLPRNDADFRLAVNRALSEIYLSGQVGELWQKWFGRYEVKPTELLLNVYRLNSLVD